MIRIGRVAEIVGTVKMQIDELLPIDIQANVKSYGNRNTKEIPILEGGLVALNHLQV
jgi:hypothetical protein